MVSVEMDVLTVDQRGGACGELDRTLDAFH